MTDMMLTGRAYSADERQQFGLSHYLLGPGEGLAKGIELARKIAGNARMTNFALTHVLPRIADAPHDQGLIKLYYRSASRRDRTKHAGSKSGHPGFPE